MTRSSTIPLCTLLVGLLFACAGPGDGSGKGCLREGAVVSEHPLATAVGLEILERGGNAADAAVATALALAVCLPQAGNLGGGGFAVQVAPTGEAWALDFRETAPSAADPRRYLDEGGEHVPERSISGALAIGIPGSPHGLFELHRRCGSGRLGFAQLVEPAIRLAREGFGVDPWLARDLGRARVMEKMNAPARAVFYPGGVPLVAGQRLVQQDLARTLERYAREGPDGFYRGWVAAALVREVLRTPVPGVGLPSADTLSLEDLAAYRSQERPVLRGRFRGHELLTMPPPSSGGLVVLSVLGVLDGLPLEGEVDGADGEPGERLLHWWIEAMRQAFADRALHMGDPDFYPVPTDNLLAPEWIAARRVAIGEQAAPDVAAWAPAPPPESEQTTHLSVVDRTGGAVAMTTTLNASFGCGTMVQGCGFLLNNELDDFAIAAGVPNMFGLVGSTANAIRPGKRPLSSMSPTIVLGPQGRVRLVLGSPGGPRIITATLQVLLRTLVGGQDLRTAVRAPRLHQQWSPASTLFEATPRFSWEPGPLEALVGRGHPIERVERRFGSVQAIWIDGRSPIACSDPRRGGAGGTERGGVARPAMPPR
ncbi:MAG: gamma-glutamyltransferase [Planctomycetota bacterium]|nr:gamma-glutamyltransferase [Planctomycetota bacterium]